METPRRKTPWWMTLLSLAMLLPLAWILTSSATSSGTGDEGSSVSLIAEFFPFFALSAAGLAWYSYPERPTVSWILLAVLALSYVAMYVLINN